MGVCNYRDSLPFRVFTSSHGVPCNLDNTCTPSLFHLNFTNLLFIIFAIYAVRNRKRVSHKPCSV